MKKTQKIVICLVVAVAILAMVLSACDLTRKVNGAEVQFQKKLTSAEKYSFDMHLNIQSNGTESNLDLSCYKDGNDYAYTFYAPDTRAVQYRRLYADNNLYEYAEQTAVLNAGTYYTNAGVPYTDDDNLMYAMTQKIMLASYATLLMDGVKDKVNGVDTYRYDFALKGNQYSLWFDDENMVKISATFISTDSSGNTTSETYTAVFSNYVFGEVAAAPFTRPSDMGIGYVQSPVSIEAWMTIMTQFANRASNWL